MKSKRNNKGQAMVEYIIIVVLIAIALIVLVGKFGHVVGIKWGGAISSLDEDAASVVNDEMQKLDDNNKIKKLQSDGSFGGN